MLRFMILCSLSLGACVAADDSVALDSTDTELTQSFAARVCMQRDVVIGQCGTADGLFVACDLAFDAACKAGGGTVGPAIPLVIHCQDNSSMFHDCDKDFKAACRDEEGKFSCGNPDCSSGTCKI
jgi:hypothetical protein